MSNAKKRRRTRALQKLILVLVVLFIVALLGYFFILTPAKKKVTSAIAEKLIESQITEEENVSGKEVLESMSEEDQAVIDEIVNEHISAEAISDVTSYITSGDTSGLKEYAKSSLTEEELAQIKEIYSKYRDEIQDYLKQ